MASTSANERAEHTAHLQNKRGETVVLVFSMQGWGNVINTIVILSLLAMYSQWGSKTPLVFGASVLGAGFTNSTLAAVVPISNAVASSVNSNATLAKVAGTYTMSVNGAILSSGTTFAIVSGGATASGGGYYYVSMMVAIHLPVVLHVEQCFCTAPNCCHDPNCLTGPARPVCRVAHLLLLWPDPHPLHARLACLCKWSCQLFTSDVLPGQGCYYRLLAFARLDRPH